MEVLIGRVAKDTVTGFVGEVTAHATFKARTDMVTLEAMDDVGHPVEKWFDVDRLKFIDEE